MAIGSSGKIVSIGDLGGIVKTEKTAKVDELPIATGTGQKSKYDRTTDEVPKHRSRR